MQHSILKQLGLSDKEITVYLKLLEYGAISVRGLAELTDINRGTAYDILKKLQELGLASYYHQDTKQKFVAESPDKLQKIFRERETEFKQTEKKLKELIPELKCLHEKGGNKPVAKFYEGRNGIKFILDDVLATLKPGKTAEYYVYSAADVREDIVNAYPDFTKKRIKNKTKVKTISLAPGGKTFGLDERKWIKAQGEPGKTYTLIYAGKCAFISRDLSGTPVGVIIENQMIYETQKIIFLQLWNLL